MNKKIMDYKVALCKRKDYYSTIREKIPFGLSPDEYGYLVEYGKERVTVAWVSPSGTGNSYTKEWLERLIVEHFELKKKCEKLEAFLNGDNDVDTKDLLVEQLEVMKKYLVVLEVRLTKELNKLETNVDTKLRVLSNTFLDSACGLFSGVGLDVGKCTQTEKWLMLKNSLLKNTIECRATYSVEDSEYCIQFFIEDRLFGIVKNTDRDECVKEAIKSMATIVSGQVK